MKRQLTDHLLHDPTSHGAVTYRVVKFTASDGATALIPVDVKDLAWSEESALGVAEERAERVIMRLRESS